MRTWEEGGQPKALSSGSPAPSLPGLWSAGHMVFTASHVRLTLWFRPGIIPDLLCPPLSDSCISTGQPVVFPVFHMGHKRFHPCLHSTRSSALLYIPSRGVVFSRFFNPSLGLGCFGWLWISLLSFEPLQDSFRMGGTTIPQALLRHWTTGA